MRFPGFLQSSFLLCTASLILSGCGATSTNSSSGSSGNPTNPSNPSGSSSSTVAYVYVANATASGGPYQIVAYAANSNGQLTAVPGSPFAQNVDSLAASANYLLAATTTGSDINTYTIGSNGAITLGPQFNYGTDLGYQSSNNSVCSYLGNLLFDPAGKSLYGEVGNIQCSDNNAIASFGLDSSNGNLTYLGNTNIGYEASGYIALLGNDDYAYSALFNGCMYGGLTSFSRASSGLLSVASITTTPPHGPPPPPGATSNSVQEPGYDAGFTAADTTNHVAIAEYPCFAQSGTTPQIQLAAWTADANGNLTTSDTYATMPSTAITTVEDMKTSPSGSILAVGGVGGLQLFHFNGSSSITSFGNVLTTDNITQVFWDNSNHLYAITGSAAGSSSATPGKLHVFTVTDSSASEASGSPYTITQPIAIAVATQSH